MWKRNLVFWAVCLGGCGWLAGSLLRDERIEPPKLLEQLQVDQDDILRVAAEVDRQFQARWEQLGLSAAEPASPSTLIRRLSLSLAGTVPSLEELRAWEKVPADQQVQWWLARLLEDPRFSDHVGERLARMYVGAENGPFLLYRRNRFVRWLGEQLLENRPYDQLVQELIADTGLWTSDPAVNFVTVTLDQNNDNKPDPIRLAGRTSRAFLGMRIDCLQCHDDQLSEVGLGSADAPRTGRQEDFHQLAAFFSEARVSFLGVNDRPEEYTYQFLGDEHEVTVAPTPPFAPELLGEAANRREQLAAWVTHPQNRAFARTAVNRFWAILFGRPLAEPIDDIPLYGEFPPGMETLADDLIAHDFDVRRLIRVMAATAAFRRDSRADFEVTPQHEKEWAVFPLSRLRPEQVAGAVRQASSLKTLDANRHIVLRLIGYAQQNEFVKRYGDTGEDEFDERPGTIPQRLIMMNGELIQEHTKENPLTNAATQLALLAPTDQQAVDLAYLCTLSRLPSGQERQHFIERLRDTQGPRRQQVMEDLYWVLFNSTEFLWNH